MPRPTYKAVALGYVIALLFILTASGSMPYITASLALILLSLMAYSRGFSERQARALRSLTLSRRVEPDYTYEGLTVSVEITLKNDGEIGLKGLMIKDLLPPRLGGSEAFLVDEIEPKQAKIISYDVRPTPGLHEFKSLTLEAGDPLGLFLEKRSIEAYATLRVTPLYVAGGVEGMPMQFYGLAEVYSRNVRGGGYELYEVREYQPGDDPRRIAWSATARYGRLIVREDLSEILTKIHLFIDLSLDVWMGAPGVSSGDYIMRAAGSIAFNASKSGGLLGYTIYSGYAWVQRAPMRGTLVHQDLTVKLSMYNPLESTRRSRVYEALSETSKVAGVGRLLVLTGPGFLRDGVVSDVVDALSMHRGSRGILVFLPTGSDRVSETLRLIEGYYYSRIGVKLREAGFTVYIGEGLKPLAAFWRLG